MFLVLNICFVERLNIHEDDRENNFNDQIILQCSKDTSEILQQVTEPRTNRSDCLLHRLISSD